MQGSPERSSAASLADFPEDGAWATVLAVEDTTPAIRLLTLQSDRPVPTVAPGSHLDVTVPLARGTVTRSYSLIDLGLDDGLLRIAVRLDTSGRGGSQWMHTLTPGRRLAVHGPISEFTPSPGHRPSVLLAGGIGITPVLGLARAIRAAGRDYRIVYTGRSRPTMAFVEHLASEHAEHLEIVETGLGASVDAPELVATVPDGGTLYVCGPMRLLADIRAAWQQAGRPPGGLRFETFGTSGSLAAVPFRVLILSRGVAVEVAVGTTMLDALTDAGVEVMYDCLRGECGLCRVQILSRDGLVDHRDVFLSERQRAEGREICTCVSRMAGTSITIDCRDPRGRRAAEVYSL